MADDGKTPEQVLQELDALTHSLFQAHTARRTASLALPRSAVPAVDAATAPPSAADRPESRPRSRRMSMTSPWRSRPKPEAEEGADKPQSAAAATPAAEAAGDQKKGSIWNWKPMRALSHIGMNRLGCLFSVEVVAAQGLPPTMNGLRLAVLVRKKETRDGAVQTMPARVLQGAADFEETLFIRCHVYCSGGGASGKPLKFEPRPFLISAVAVDAPELDFGHGAVELTALVKESMERSAEDERVRRWDKAFSLAGKAKGGQLVVKLGFQIMEEKGGSSTSASSLFVARKQSKSSFSVTSPRVSRSEPSSTPVRGLSAADMADIDEFNLDDSGKIADANDELELPEFDVVDKGVEVQQLEKTVAEKTAGDGDGDDDDEAAGEVVKEVVHDSARLTRLSELETIAKQIKALESMMVDDAGDESVVVNEPARLDADEETVTKEFLQMLEQAEDDARLGLAANSLKSGAVKAKADTDAVVFVSDLGRGLGPVVQTRSGGFLIAMNPFDIPVLKKETPKLAMQLSRPLLLADESNNGVEAFQRLCAAGCDALCAKLTAAAVVDDLVGKTAEQIAFEGMAAVILAGGSSSAGRSVSLLRTMAAAMAEERRERIATGIWNARAEPVNADEIVAVSLQKVEAMVLEALKIQADMSDEPPPFQVSAAAARPGDKHPLDSAVPVEEYWNGKCTDSGKVTVLFVVQLRDPLRRYEAVGAPAVVMIQAAKVEEAKFKVVSMHVGGVRLRARRSAWDGERQRLTAKQWLVAYGMGKSTSGRKGMPPPAAAAADKGGGDLLWSASARVMADMWLKAMRNPDVFFPDKH